MFWKIEFPCLVKQTFISWRYVLHGISMSFSFLIECRRTAKHFQTIMSFSNRRVSILLRFRWVFSFLCNLWLLLNVVHLQLKIFLLINFINEKRCVTTKCVKLKWTEMYLVRIWMLRALISCFLVCFLYRSLGESPRFSLIWSIQRFTLRNLFVLILEKRFKIAQKSCLT